MQINRDNYRGYDAVNFSLLSTLAFDPSQVKQDSKEPTEAMNFGSLFDCLITDVDRFDEEFIVSEVEKPTAQLGEFIDLYLELKRIDIPDSDVYQMAHDEMKRRNPKLRDGLEKFINRIETEGKPWLEFIEVSKVKKVITNDEFNLATRMKDALKTNQFTSKYFNMPIGWETEYQVPLLGTILGILFKGLVDMLLINHATKEIIPIDIKTTSEYPNNFQKSVQKWNYLLQASLYWEIIQLNYPDYKIHDFIFMVSSKKLPNKPYLWRVDKSGRYVGRYGTTTRNGMKIRGFEELATDLKWHEETGLWEYPKQMYENEGMNVIDYYL